MLYALFFMQSCVAQKDMKHFMSAKYLLDLNNSKTSLSQNILNEKPYVVIIIATDCPICQRYVPILRGMKDSLQDIKFVLVFSKWETLDDIKAFEAEFINDKSIKNHPINCITLLQDNKNKLIKTLKATTTPEAFFYDKNHQLQYRGAIDNWFFALGRYRPQATEYYLKNAITQYLKNEKITVSKTNPIGCLIEY
jgi:thiol-disulfide isomerase/thioredoxin